MLQKHIYSCDAHGRKIRIFTILNLRRYFWRILRDILWDMIICVLHINILKSVYSVMSGRICM